MSRLIVCFLTVALLMGMAREADAGWSRIATVPPAVRAIAVSPRGDIVGFSTNRSGAVLFGVSARAAASSRRLPDAPRFYAYAHDSPGSRLCFVLSSGSRLDCYDAQLRSLRLSLPGRMISGAIVGPGHIWILDDSPHREPFLLMEESSGSLIVKRRASPPGCSYGQDPKCSELEIHPLADKETLAIVHLLGTFDGHQVRYPDVTFWNTSTNEVRVVRLPSREVSPALRKEYRSMVNVPSRLVYRSAVSPMGKLAVILAAPESLLKPGLDRNELWYWDGIRESWQMIPVPAPVTAVAFQGESPAVVTIDGGVYVWSR